MAPSTTPSDNSQPSPPEQAQLSAVLGWCIEAVQEGEAYLKSQPGFDKIDRCIRRINGENEEVRPTSLSKVTSNRIGNIALNLSASLTDIKPFWEYRTYNKKFEQQATLGNKIATSWWLQRQMDMRFADCIKYALVAGSGYAHHIYNRDTDDLDMLPEDPRDVIPIRPASKLSIQDCFGVLIRRERTVNYLKAAYPKYASLIKPDREGVSSAVGRYNAITSQIEQMGLDAAPFWVHMDASKRRSTEMTIPMVDEYIVYIKDPSRNKSSFPVVVGDPQTGNSYQVQPGELLYPRLRRINFCRSCTLSDGPSPYWHGLFPLTKITLDPWPWTWLGKAPLWDLLPLQDELDRLLRVVSDRNQKVARPDLQVNASAMSRAAFDKINTRLAGLKMRTNPIGGPNPAQLIPPPPMDTGIIETIQWLCDEMDRLSGVKDISQVATLNQIPASETIERMMEAMTPLVRLRSRSLEATLREFAMITLSNIFQFYTLPKRLALLGPDGMTFEDFDTDPGNLIPRDSAAELGLSPDSPREERAKAMLQMFTYHVAPGSLLSASEATRKMLYVQLARMGYIDHWTLLDVLGVPNVGNAPGNTITERLAAEQQMGMGMAVGPAGASAGAPNAAGRKASGQEMPRLVVKES